MLLVIFLAQKFLLLGGNVADFFILVALGVIVYLGIMYSYDKTRGNQMQNLISQVFSSLGGIKHD
jgi:hypothetical protein